MFVLVIFCSGNDSFADPEDVRILYSLLPRPPVFVHNEPRCGFPFCSTPNLSALFSYTHLDPIWAVDAHSKIYPSIIELIKKYT